MNAHPTHPLCYCGLRSLRWTSHTKRYPNREFYRCPKPIGEQCRYLHWLDGRGNYKWQDDDEDEAVQADRAKAEATSDDSSAGELKAEEKPNGCSSEEEEEEEEEEDEWLEEDEEWKEEDEEYVPSKGHGKMLQRRRILDSDEDTDTEEHDSESESQCNSDSDSESDANSEEVAEQEQAAALEKPDACMRRNRSNKRRQVLDSEGDTENEEHDSHSDTDKDVEGEDDDIKPSEEPEAHESRRRSQKRRQIVVSDEDTDSKERDSEDEDGSNDNRTDTILESPVSSINLDPVHEAMQRLWREAASALNAQSPSPFKIKHTISISPTHLGVNSGSGASLTAIMTESGFLTPPPAINDKPPALRKAGPITRGRAARAIKIRKVRKIRTAPDLKGSRKRPHVCKLLLKELEDLMD